MDPLDNPVWAALTGPQERFGRRHGRAARFDPEVSPFAALDDPGDAAAWDDLRKLVEPGERVIVAAPGLKVPDGWEGDELPGFQLVGPDCRGAPAPGSVELGAADVPEMLDLRERTRPGPLLARTVELGGYRGFRRDGVLAAMAGRRMHVPGWVEISAVCTDPAFRGEGLATRLIAAVTDGIRADGERPFLHVAGDNTAAIRLYERLGFAVRTPVNFSGVTPR
ncbi:GNAT family N-acetyltransferase [Symbioplanes lichenis]|uniref:GNAT family N-acetyltransferase n=1 Tax=Symbioplanes lichenis TaxID=1629072 RepID=UPI0027381D9B|nr:GNAT family N-acetyltransferase [Actinoplanes lichenis]